MKNREILITSILSVVLLLMPIWVFAQSAETMSCIADNYRSRALHEALNYEEALEICNEGLAFFQPIESDYPEELAGIYGIRAEIYSRWGKYEDAIPDYNKAIKLAPDYLYLHMNLGRIYIKMGETERQYYQKAIELYSYVIMADSGNNFPFMYRAETYHLLGENDQAMADINSALALSDGYWETHYIKARILFSQGECEKALEALNYALVLENFDEEPFFSLRPPLLMLKAQIESMISNES